MRKSVISLALAAGAAASGLAVAQQAPAPSPFTGNMTLASEYRFRGIDQTAGKPALQGGFDYSHQSGVYLGNWNSNVSQGAGYPGGNLEMDFYGGYKKAFGDLGLDVGAIYYYYPGTHAGAAAFPAVGNNRTGEVHTGRIDNKELYIGGSWKFLSLKYFHSIDNYFSVPDSKNSNYIDLSAAYDLGQGWGLVGHLGHLNFKGVDNGSYSDWKLGATKDLAGWLFGASYIGTNAKGSCSNGEPYCFADTTAGSPRDAGRSTIVLSVGKTF
jgi:uncharacterized protein (TIGR02001 family)